jgi:thiamine biosynthesis lipoprotein ApbE
MLTLVEITVFKNDENKAELAIQNAFKVGRIYERPYSWIRSFCNQSGRRCSICNRISQGVKGHRMNSILGRKNRRALDISVGPLQELWKFDIDHPFPPDKTAIEQKLSKVGYDKIHLEN